MRRIEPPGGRSRAHASGHSRRCGPPQAKPGRRLHTEACLRRAHAVPSPLRNPAVSTEGILRRELQLLGMYRLFEAALLALLVFSPLAAMLDAPRHPRLGYAACVAYLLVALALFHRGRTHPHLRWQVAVGLGVDIAFSALVMHALPSIAPGIALMLLFNIGIGALLLPLRLALGAGVLAALASVGEYLFAILHDGESTRALAEVVMFAVSNMAMALLTYLLGQQMRESTRLAEKRGAEVADLSALSALIIHRMRTGVLLVDGNDNILMANEAALGLLGDGEERDLAMLSPELARRLHAWRREQSGDEQPLALTREQSQVLPRFARLQADGDNVLVFLDDASFVSRRAETLTLATMGRFSASLAHEIRNPLAAISYATQLLEESAGIPEGDRRLLQIIHQQCQRTNGIIESVLGLARRERANPEYVDLASFVRRFVDDYQQTTPLDNGTLQAQGNSDTVAALFDPRHLQQVLTVLVQNALYHGRMPGQPAKVALRVAVAANGPQIDVVDRGPGIPEAVAANLFRPFYTTAEYGTGLGLYIARELCLANQANLEYVPVAGGGSCFRLTLTGAQSLHLR